MTDTSPDDLTYEQALAELDILISKLEKGDVDLDEAINCYERGSRLAQHCEGLLDRTEQKVTQLVVGAGGALAEKPLDATTPAEPQPRSLPRPLPVARRAQSSPPIDPDDIPF